MKHWSLAAAALVCGLSACDSREDAPSASLNHLPPVSSGLTGCKVLRVTPGDATKDVFVNTTFSVTYKAAATAKCKDLALFDALGQPVATTRFHTDVWASEIEGVAGTQAISPNADLLPGALYTLQFDGRTVASFQTGLATSRQGALLSARDQPMAFGGLPQSAIVSARDVNQSLGAVIAHFASINRVAASLIQTALTAEIGNVAKPKAIYNVHLKRVEYASTQADGTPVTLSGLLAYPEYTDGSPFDYSKAKLILGERGATFDDDFPSNANTFEAVLGLLTAGKGNIFFIPDLIGFGSSSDKKQAYLVAQDTATASQDMLLAVREFFSANHAGVSLSRDLTIVGGSQGGYSSFAVLPYLSGRGLVNVVAIWGEAGPYDVFRTFTSNLLTLAGAPKDGYSVYEDPSFVPSYAMYVLDAFNAYGNLFYDPSAVLSADGKTFSPTFLKDFSLSKYPDFVDQMGVNSFPGSSETYNIPAAKVSLYHYSGDTLVPSRNTDDMIAFLNNGKHKIASVTRGSCRESAGFTKLILSASDSSGTTHAFCALYMIDDLLGSL
jgi:hypothetical protein